MKNNNENNEAPKPVYSFLVECPPAAAYQACASALSIMSNLYIQRADEQERIFEASIRVSLWSRGEDLLISLSPVGETETRISVSSGTGKQLLGGERNHRNYDDLECAVRYQISRLPV